MPAHHLIQRHYFSHLSALTHAFVQYASTTLRDALAQRGQASLVVPGGQTPRAYLPQLGQQDLPWDQIYITLSDERWVNACHQDSNERLLREHFLQNMRIPPHFIPFKTSHAHPELAIASLHTRLSAIPRPFSLTILGLGEDGHIASLFPGMTLDPSAPHLCQAATPPAAPALRMSLSFRALIDSDHISLVITGNGKRQFLDQMIARPDPSLPFIKLLQHKPVTVFETDTTYQE
ncbi:6-phosphogluconolactonase [Nitrosomonas sp. ANs5]|uniref:6-phosphogluconolactonase n=1 Tax=Nitrosomonas sp. ANs5 TaxID=3423941 RepID=UPI003D345144